MIFGKTFKEIEEEENNKIIANIKLATTARKKFVFFPVILDDGRWAAFRYVWVVASVSLNGKVHYSDWPYLTKEAATSVANFYRYDNQSAWHRQEWVKIIPSWFLTVDGK